MRCRNCDYPLWNLPARACPECGDPFAPSEFEFKPGAVKYCCPDCQQEYYGTSRKGHLRPSSFECVQCKRQLEMDEMVLLPAEGWDERVVVSHSAPWTRQDIGHVRRWFATVGWSYVRPGDLIAGIPVDKGLGQSWAFMTITQLLVGLIGFALPIVVIIILVSVRRLSPRCPFRTRVPSHACRNRGPLSPAQQLQSSAHRFVPASTARVTECCLRRGGAHHVRVL